MKYAAIIPSLLLAAGLSHAVPTLVERDAKPFEEGSGNCILEITTQGGGNCKAVATPAEKSGTIAKTTHEPDQWDSCSWDDNI